MRWVYHCDAFVLILIFVELTTEEASLKYAPLGFSHNSPNVINSQLSGTRPISVFLGFVAEAFGEEFVHEGLFQLGGGLNDPLLRFNRPLHCRKDMRDFLLFGEWWERKLELPK